MTMARFSKRRTTMRNDSYILNEYYDWVCGNGHDHAFVAERVGLDLDDCHDDEVNYKIALSV